MAMKREDYERGALPNYVDDPKSVKIMPTRGAEVARFDVPGEDPFIGLKLIYDDDMAPPTLILSTKDRADRLIAGLIAARNDLWPTP